MPYALSNLTSEAFDTEKIPDPDRAEQNIQIGPAGTSFKYMKKVPTRPP